jgi:hypothetical protein
MTNLMSHKVVALMNDRTKERRETRKEERCLTLGAKKLKTLEYVGGKTGNSRTQEDSDGTRLRALESTSRTQ